VLYRFRHQVERADIVTRFGEVRRHSAAHVTEADECDLRHLLTPRSPAKAGVQSTTK
jgi:hypothetical protein